MNARFLLLGGVMLATGAHAADKLALAPVSYKQVPLTYAAEGVVEAVKQATVSAQISGRIVEVHFKAGDFVKLSFDFQSGESLVAEVPVVTNAAPYNKLPSASPSASPAKSPAE